MVKNHLLGGLALLFVGSVPATVSAAPLCIGCTGTNGWGIDFNSSTYQLTIVSPGEKQIVADPGTNTETITRRDGTVVTKQYASKLGGGPTMALARFFYARSH